MKRGKMEIDFIEAPSALHCIHYMLPPHIVFNVPFKNKIQLRLTFWPHALQIWYLFSSYYSSVQICCFFFIAFVDCISFMHWFCFTCVCSTTVNILRIQNTLVNVYIGSIFLIADAIDLVKEKKKGFGRVELKDNQLRYVVSVVCDWIASSEWNRCCFIMPNKYELAKRHFNWFFYVYIYVCFCDGPKAYPFWGRCISRYGCACINYWWSIRGTTNILIFPKISWIKCKLKTIWRIIIFDLCKYCICLNVLLFVCLFMLFSFLQNTFSFLSQFLSIFICFYVSCDIHFIHFSAVLAAENHIFVSILRLRSIETICHRFFFDTYKVLVAVLERNCTISFSIQYTHLTLPRRILRVENALAWRCWG